VGCGSDVSPTGGVLGFFEIQISIPNQERFGLRYTISDDGSLQQDSASGGLDVYGLPGDARVGLYAHWTTLPDHVRAELVRRGWAFNGRRIDAPGSEQRVFSSGGYGLIREHLGTWP
jgi:hypothetical protein